MRLLANTLGSKKTLLTVILVLVCVIMYLSFFQQSSVVCSSQQRKVELCRCPTRVTVAQRSDKKMANDSSCYLGSSRQFPQAIIIGVRKTGTRALINMLRTHPEIFAAVGEVHFFDRDVNFEKGIQWYIDQMPCTKKMQITIEKSPSYFTTESVPARIKTFSANIKLFLIVRDPIDRTVSDFTQLSDWWNGESQKDMTFEKLAFNSSTGAVCTEYSPIAHSIYVKFLRIWLEHFKLDQIHIVDGDTLIKNPVEELKKAESFLGVRSFFHDKMFYFNQTKGFYCWKKTNKKGREFPYCLGDGKGRKHPKISNVATAKLKNFFKPFNEQFYSLAHREFHW